MRVVTCCQATGSGCGTTGALRRVCEVQCHASVVVETGGVTLLGLNSNLLLESIISRLFDLLRPGGSFYLPHPSLACVLHLPLLQRHPILAPSLESLLLVGFIVRSAAPNRTEPLSQEY